MNKKLLLSLGLVTLVLAAAIGGTVAFFSDTETSTGNSFTAGAIDLKIDSKCTYNGLKSDQCGTWELKDLNTTVATDSLTVPTVASDKFFNFIDVKPGDFGENTISMHVFNNDAHACFIVNNMANDDIDLTEPEREDGDSTVGAANGELAQNINFFAWDDLDGDNIWEAEEKPLFTNTYGPASDVLDGKSYYLGVLPGTVTKYLGVYWCYGAITVDESTHSLACSGASLDNTTQTDSLTADVKFYVEQTRHNEQFVCPDATPWINAVGAINDDGASSGGWYMRHVGNPAPDGYSHGYQWGPKLTCDPNTTPVTLTGTIDVNPMPIGGVSMIGLLDKSLLEGNVGGYQTGAYLYVHHKAADSVIIGPTDGNAGGELVQVFGTYPLGDGIFDIVTTIHNGTIQISVDGNPITPDTYGDIKGAISGAEFENGAYLGWDNYPEANYMPYSFTVTGCN